MLALQSQESTEAVTAKEAVLATQNSDGCFKNVNTRDTAFLLYSAWPLSLGGRGSRTECDFNEDCNLNEICTNNKCVDPVQPDYCLSEGHYCLSS